MLSGSYMYIYQLETRSHQHMTLCIIILHYQSNFRCSYTFECKY